MPFLEEKHSPALPVRLVLLVAGSILPLALIAGITTYELSRAYDDAASERLLRLSKSVLSIVDGQIASVITAEEVLAASSALQDNDLERFRRDAQAFLQASYPNENFVLSDLNDVQLVNTLASDPFAKRKNTSAAILAAHHELIETGKPVVSHLLNGQVIHQFAIGVETPVLQHGKLTYILGMPVTSKSLSETLARQQFDPKWTVAIWDRDGNVVARIPDWQEYVGRKAAPSVYSAIFRGGDNVITSTTFDGTKVLTAIAHSSQNGLTLALGVPSTSAIGPQRQALFSLIVFTAVCLLISSVAAVRQARSLQAAERTRDLLIQELNHRIGNLLSTVQGIVQLTLRSAKTKEEAEGSLLDRIMALARVNRLLTDEDWRSTELSNVISAALEPHLQAPERIQIVGTQDVLVSPRDSQAITLTMNELATNALKYGALSTQNGKVKIHWERDGEYTVVYWTEVDGPAVTAPTRTGFGSSLFRSLSGEPGKAVVIEYLATGVVCTVRFADKGNSPARMG
jgi:two-component sensor histidine kinase